jgi:predicted acylesterase/phospholipase RssA/CRP-like cAMP-binding protein
MRAGEPADSMYVLVAGRLEVVAGDTVVRELAAGAVVGELALLTGGTRSASVRARRDSVVLQVPRHLFDQTIHLNPASLIAVVKTLAGQLSDALPAPAAEPASRPGVVSVLAAHAGAPAARVAYLLTEQLAETMRAVLPGRLDAEGLARAERDHDCVVLVANGLDAEWDAFCRRQADLTVVVAASDTTAVPLDGVRRPELVLVGRPAPSASLAAWSAALDPWRITAVSDRDDPAAGLRPLARRLSGRSLGVVLAGGGARGFAHVGVLRELEEAGLSIDRIAGASIGAIVGSLYATGVGGDELEAALYDEFVRGRPQADYTVPRASLARGNRALAALRRSLGADTLIEALPRQFRCVSTDLLSRSPVVHQRGNLVDAVAASSRLPVLFPPMSAPGQLLVDGSVLDNLPVGTLTERGEGPIIAVNIAFGSGGSRSADPARAPRVPALGETLLRTMTIGGARSERLARELGAYVVTPSSTGVGLLEFHQFDRTVAAGRAAARQLLEQTGGQFNVPTEGGG